MQTTISPRPGIRICIALCAVFSIFFVACGPATDARTCKEAVDCLSDEVCKGGTCQAACKADDECMSGEYCDTGSGECKTGTPPPKPGRCGDGKADQGEACDGADLGGESCQKRGFQGGTLRCAPNCLLDTSGCTGKPSGCGNGTVDPGEDCDGSDLNGQLCRTQGFDTGNLKCTAACKFDTSSCQKNPQASCGNGAVDSGEDCDGSDLNGQTCQSRGYDSGALKCSSCRFDESGCKRKSTCGNGKLDPGEECDGSNLNNQSCQTKGFSSGTLSCTGGCRFETADCKNAPQPKCGDGKAEGSEACDGSDLKSQTCQSLGYTGGDLKCDKCQLDKSGCTGTPPKKKFGQACEKVDDCDAGLQCIVAKSGDKKGYCTTTCSDAKPCPSSPAGAGCILQTSSSKICGWSCTPGGNQCPPELGCVAFGNGHICAGGTPATPPKCGNNKAEAGEECDGSDLNSQTCQSQGFSSGTLKCKSGCQFDTSACKGAPTVAGFGKACPNGTCAAGLVCVNFGQGLSYCTASCSATKPCPAHTSPVSCNIKLQSGGNVCGWATSTGAPPICGNGVLDPGEDCDKTAMGATCKGLGYSGGTLGCSSQCTYVKTSCTGTTKCASLPANTCTQGCGQIVEFLPTQGKGYVVTHGSRLSWARRATMMYIKYATASVDCVYPGTKPLGMGDMSMQSGATPADTNGRLRHPQGTHVNGHDVDIAYYQKNTPNNYLRAVCAHKTNGVDQYHCTQTPHLLDVTKSAFFLAKLLESKAVRVIGVDGKIGPLVAQEMTRLHQQGMISKYVLDLFNRGAVTWEETDKGRGWYRFHHHHLHVSFR